MDDATETVVEGEVELEVRGGAGVTEYHLPQSHWSVALVNPTTHTHTHTHNLVRTPYILWDDTVYTCIPVQDCPLTPASYRAVEERERERRFWQCDMSE